jgi:uncharacterized damage-inducible protein DinB
MSETNEPFTKENLAQAFESVNKKVATFFTSIPIEEFYAHPPEVWSARDNLDHLNKSVGPVVTALRLPKFLPAILFGKAIKPSRTFEQIKETYQGKLAEGAEAGGRYVPDKVEMPSNAEQQKQELLQKWTNVSDKLVKALDKWSEGDLDKYRLPHPILGKLTVREMLLFTLYHNTHHVNNVRKLLQG